MMAVKDMDRADLSRVAEEDDETPSPFDFDVTIRKTIGTVKEGDKTVFFGNLPIGPVEAALILIGRNDESGEYSFTVPNGITKGALRVDVNVQFSDG